MAAGTGDGRRSERRRAVLDTLRAAGGPLGVGEIAERLRVHPNTVRFHLDALLDQGRVEPFQLEPAGPGRPRTVYASRRGMDRDGARRYQLLARILLSRMASSGSAAQAEAVATGREWGRHLVEQPPPFHTPTPRESVERLTRMLDELGFDPQPTAIDGRAEGIRLRHCPFLELAEEYGPVVCPLHLGLMQGALAELRAPLLATGLTPFAEPDACLAHLAAAQA